VQPAPTISSLVTKINILEGAAHLLVGQREYPVRTFLLEDLCQGREYLLAARMRLQAGPATVSSHEARAKG